MSGSNGELEGASSLWHEEAEPVPLLGSGAAEELSQRLPNNGDRPHAQAAAIAAAAELGRVLGRTDAARRRHSPAERLAPRPLPADRRAGSDRAERGRAPPPRTRRGVKAPIHGCRKVAFISRKGGVGKTTTCLLAGHTFASLRGDRVIALDGNPDAGTLGHRVRRETSATVSSLLDDVERISRYADIRGYTSQAPSRLEVVAADDDPRITQALGESEFRRAIELLERHYNLLCLDTGTGVLESATRGILGAADQIVVVSAPSLDGARAASSTLDWLEQNGYDHLVRGAVAVLNAVRRLERCRRPRPHRAALRGALPDVRPDPLGPASRLRRRGDARRPPRQHA